jgi:hypothetical protein
MERAANVQHSPPHSTPANWKLAPTAATQLSIVQEATLMLLTRVRAPIAST